jgi:hypothetical protein
VRGSPRCSVIACRRSIGLVYIERSAPPAKGVPGSSLELTTFRGITEVGTA